MIVTIGETTTITSVTALHFPAAKSSACCHDSTTPFMGRHHTIITRCRRCHGTRNERNVIGWIVNVVLMVLMIVLDTTIIVTGVQQGTERNGVRVRVNIIVETLW